MKKGDLTIRLFPRPLTHYDLQVNGCYLISILKHGFVIYQCLTFLWGSLEYQTLLLVWYWWDYCWAANASVSVVLETCSLVSCECCCERSPIWSGKSMEKMHQQSHPPPKKSGCGSISCKSKEGLNNKLWRRLWYHGAVWQIYMPFSHSGLSY